MGLIETITNRLYRPLLEVYLLNDRTYSYDGVAIVVKGGVYHPGFSPRAKLLLEEVAQVDLKGKKLLDLGSGSGLLALVAAKRGAHVTASDIGSAAVACTTENANRNKLAVEVVQSDVFANMPEQQFDYIIINPPYLRGEPENAKAMRLYAGQKLEYFTKLFMRLDKYINPNSVVLMALPENCELDVVKQMAAEKGFAMELLKSNKNWQGGSCIYEVKPA